MSYSLPYAVLSVTPVTKALIIYVTMCGRCCTVSIVTEKFCLIQLFYGVVDCLLALCWSCYSWLSNYCFKPNTPDFQLHKHIHCAILTNWFLGPRVILFVLYRMCQLRVNRALRGSILHRPYEHALGWSFQQHSWLVKCSFAVINTHA